MKLINQELNEESLKTYISEKLEDFEDVKNAVIAGLQNKINSVQKQETNDFSKIISFLEKSSLEKLIMKVLLNEKSTSKQYKSPNEKVGNRALYYFARHKDVKTVVKNFRELYPKWNEAKHLLPKKTNQNGNSVVVFSELTNVQETKEEKSQSELKKKVKNKDKKRKNQGLEDDADCTKNVEMPQKKKNKKSLGISNGNNSCTMPQKKSKKSLDISIGNASCIIPQKKEVEKSPVKSNGFENYGMLPDKGDEASSDSSSGSESCGIPQSKNVKESSLTINLSNTEGVRTPKKLNFHQKMQARRMEQKKNFNGKERRGGPRNRFGSGRAAPPRDGKLSWKIKRHVDKGSANLVNVPSDWKEKLTISPKTEDSPSLLRPSWLTNPEEAKPSTNYDRSSFYDRSSSYNRRSGRGRSFGSSNRIPVSSDWKTKCLEPKADGAQTSSLLKPDWLTNPSEERKPGPAFRGRGRGRGRSFR